MKAALISFAATAALLTLDVGLLPNAGRASVEDTSGFVERHAHEDAAELEARLGLTKA
jgi:hypothetical protein